ncbi:hypothetical protein CISG_10159 [Coccidioides immitis RMSCC 3703]|uniref:Uncharacterized protein n=1 Tax=Coccidioides immitis RMSCC 3703 TaxID=454286 RepID=A0A0J8QMW8_COCIT|nr:hypothetical protein CISG_10159 [Coccidioides immitis RMSCC 3703]
MDSPTLLKKMQSAKINYILTIFHKKYSNFFDRTGPIVQQLITKSEERFKDNNSENIHRLLLLLKYTVQIRSASWQLKQEKDYLDAQDDPAAKTEAEAAITVVIGKEFQGNVKIGSTNKDIDTNFEENINDAIKT